MAINLEQTKSDLNNGVLVCRATLVELVELAIKQQDALIEFIEVPNTSEVSTEGGYKWCCVHCGEPGEHKEFCLMTRASNLVNQGDQK